MGRAEDRSPANDDFEHRANRTETSTAAVTFLTGATVEEGEPAHAGNVPTRSLWWSWTAPYTGQAILSLYGTDSLGIFGSPPSLAVYTGEVLSALSEIGSNNHGGAGLAQPTQDPSANLSTQVDVIAGQTYQIALADRSAFSSWESRPALVVLGINQPPTIISSPSVTGEEGVPVTYQISGTNKPFWFTATDLPEGLLLNPFTGQIIGSPHTPGIFDVAISAESPAGVGLATVRFDIAAAQSAPHSPPEFTSGSPVVIGYLGQSLSNNFWATHQPQSFSAETLPPGMILGTGNGSLNGVSTMFARISGTPSETGIFVVPLNASNNAGTGQAVVTYNIRELRSPEITSRAAAYGKVGQTFSYTLNASPSSGTATPTYAVAQLPLGLSLSSNNRTISGTPSEAGTFNVVVSASNDAGTSEAVLTIEIAESVNVFPVTAPLITSPASAQGVQSASFNYQIQADNAPSAYATENLPAGLSLNTATGLISGSPSQAGEYVSTISAWNHLGATSAALHLVISEVQPPQIVGAASAVGWVGHSMSYFVELKDSAGQYYTENRHFTFSAANLPPGLNFTLDEYWSTARISGTPTQAGVYEVLLAGTVSNKTTTAILTITIQEEATAAPVITSSLYYLRSKWTNLSISITATPAAVGYTASPLPPGLQFDTATGRFSGRPETEGVYVIDVSASNAVGTGTARITLEIGPAPLVTFSGGAGAAATVGRSFSLSSSHSNPTGGTIVWEATNVPPGVVFSTSNGTFTGTPTEAGTYPVTVSASTDAGTTSVVRTIYVRALPQQPIISSSLYMNTWVGASLSYWISASEIPTVYHATNLPPGLQLSSDGRHISGTVTEPGVYEIPIFASNLGGEGRAVLTLVIDPLPPVPSVTSAGAARAYLNNPFTHTFTATPPPNAIVLDGVLPDGIAYDAVTRTISGTPQQVGDFPLEITALNDGGHQSVPFTLIVSPDLPSPVITTPAIISVPGWYPASVSFSISATPSATSFSAENLPSSLTLNGATGRIQGSLNASQQRLLLKVAAVNATGTAQATISIHNPPGYSSIGDEFGPAMAKGSVGDPFVWQFYTGPDYYMSDRTFTATGLPPGLDLNSQTGNITGTPTSVGRYDTKIMSLNHWYPLEATLTLVIEENPEPPVITSRSIVQGHAGLPLSFNLTATGHPSSYGAAGLPAGLSLDPTTGAISGTPLTAGVFNLAVSAANAGGAGEAALRVVINELPPPPVFNVVAARAAFVGIPFSFNLAATNSVTHYEAEGLPPGLVLEPSGRISGTTSGVGRYVVAVRAINAGGSTAAKLTIDVRMPDAPVVSTGALISATEGTSFSRTISASNTPATYHATNLPPGLIFNGQQNRIEGNPTHPGLYPVSIAATNAGGTNIAIISIAVAPQPRPTFNRAAAVSGLIGFPFSFSVSSSSGSSATYQVENLPPGLSLPLGSSTISGTPSTSGLFQVPVSATTAAGTTSAILTILIEESPSILPTITSQLGATAGVGMLLEYTLQSNGGSANFTVANLPSGFVFDTSTARIRGFPQTPGVYPVNVTATHAGGTASATVMLRISEPEIPMITSGLSARASTGRYFNYNITTQQSQNFLPHSFSESPGVSYSANGLPPGLSLKSASGQIQGIPTISGDFPVRISARNFKGSRTVDVLFQVANSPEGLGSESTLQVGGSTPLMISAGVGVPVNRLVWPTGGATDVTAEGLPPGLIITPTSGTSNGIPTTPGRIEGIPSASGIFPVTVTFTDGESSASAVITLRVDAVPLPPNLGTFLSLVRKATLGTSFSYLAHSEFHEGPADLFVNGLPPGLSLDTTNGRITGTPTQTGSWVVKLQASNTGGVTEANLIITVAEPSHSTLRPRLIGSAGAAGFLGVPFNFEILSQNLPHSLSVSGLPDGLEFHLTDRVSEGIPWKSGRISGVPAAEGIYPIIITAANDLGTTSAKVTISIRQAATAAPMIVIQPSPTSVVEGDSASFFAEAVGIPSPTYQWLRGDGAALSGETAPTLHFPEVSGEMHRTSYAARLTNSSGSVSSLAAMLEVSPRQLSYESWAESHNLPSEQSGPNDDPSGAGVRNLISYALGLDPNSPALEKLPSATVEDNRLILEYLMDKRADNISITPVWSTDLEDWSGIGVQKTLVTDGFDTALWRAWIDIPSKAGFMRLEISSP